MSKPPGSFDHPQSPAGIRRRFESIEMAGLSGASFVMPTHPFLSLSPPNVPVTRRYAGVTSSPRRVNAREEGRTLEAFVAVAS